MKYGRFMEYVVTPYSILSLIQYVTILNKSGKMRYPLTKKNARETCSSVSHMITLHEYIMYVCISHKTTRVVKPCPPCMFDVD